MIYVGLITPWGIFKTLCTDTEVAELNDILFKASKETCKFVQASFNEKICLADKNSEEVKAWKENNDKRNLNRQGYTVTAYSYIFPPSGILSPPERAPVEKMVCWNASVIQSLDNLTWLNLHNHGW